jgi:hypothetical protein
MLTVLDDNDKVFQALCAGASGYILKKTPPHKILEAIVELYEGGAPMTPSIARKVLTLFPRTSTINYELEKLTPLESDSAYYKSRGSAIKIADMDGDDREDILLLLANDARGNQQYHLFVMKDKKLGEVKNFSNLYEPVYDKEKQMLVSTKSVHHATYKKSHRLVADSLIFIEKISRVYDRYKKDYNEYRDTISSDKE